jgi:hypothetical protein
MEVCKAHAESLGPQRLAELMIMVIYNGIIHEQQNSKFCWVSDLGLQMTIAQQKSTHVS